MDKNKKTQTLHAHTTVSDGRLNHKEVLDICSNLKIGVVAFTEHDVVPDKKKFKLLEQYNNHPTDWIIGIEVSSGWPLDLGGGPTSGLHIVGLFVDPFNKALVEHCRKAQAARLVRMQKMVKNLNGLGFKITEKDCLKASGGEAVGRPHIVSAINYHKENRKVIEDLRLKMEDEARHNLNMAKKYKEMMSFGETQYPYALFLSDDAFIKDIYVDYQYYSDFDNSVKLVREAGGLALLAHWFSCKNKMTEEYMDKVFKDNRLDGAETVYGLFNYEAGKWEEQEKEISILKALVDKYNKLHSGGADAHTAEDFEQFAKEKWYSERTVGMAEQILNRSKVDVTWSSLKF